MEVGNSFTIKDLSSKCKSKAELYNMLVRDGQLYLPPKQEATQRFLRDVMMGKKSYIKCDDVKVTKVPQYKGLTVKNILKFARDQMNIDKYIPEFDYPKEPNREWLCNIINTLLHDEFQKFILKIVEERRNELIHSQNLGITVRPEFLNIFKKSQAVSIQTGKSHFLARVPKTTKDHIQIRKLEMENEEVKERKFEAFEEIRKLKSKLKEMEESQKDAEDNLEKLSKLYQLGIIDANGEYINNDMK